MVAFSLRGFFIHQQYNSIQFKIRFIATVHKEIHEFPNQFELLTIMTVTKKSNNACSIFSINNYKCRKCDKDHIVCPAYNSANKLCTNRKEQKQANKKDNCLAVQCLN